VTLQMTTSLRPILGRSETLLTQEKKFFLQHWGDHFGETLTPKAAVTTPAVNPAPAPAEAPSSGGGRNPFNER
jgi:hypothetical protein